MAIDKKKTQNIITIVVVALAVILIAVVVLVKKGVIILDRTTTQEYIIESTVVTVAQTDENGENVTDENGEIIYYTMVDYYSKPSISSNHTYPATKKEGSGTTAPNFYYEITEVVGVTDADGNAVTDENGLWVTKINKQTQKCDENGNPIINGTTAKPTTTTTTEPSSQTTSIVYKTDPISKKPRKDIHGNLIVDEVLTEAPTEAPTTTTKPVVINGNTTTTTKKATTTKKPTTTTTTTTKPTTESTTEEVTEPSTENTYIEPSTEVEAPIVDSLD